MSVSENCVRFGDRLALLIDAGVAVKDAAATLGIPRQRCYAVVRAMGRPVGSSRPVRREVDPGQVVAVFNATGSMNQAAKAAGVSHSLARRLLVAEGLVSATRQPRGKAAAKRWFLDLIDSGWSASRAAREVGVHERTGRDWRDGVRKIGDTRIHPDGVVVDYRTGDRYLAPVITSGNDAPRAISTRYLSMQDRLTIDDGLLSGQTLTQITADINKHTSTVSREVRAHRVDGLYLPYHADAAAARARARPKQSKLVANQDLRQAVEDGLSRRLSPEQISHRLRRDFPDDESMQVSHETIYQALYFQARGGLKHQVQQALRSGARDAYRTGLPIGALTGSSIR